MQRHFRRGITRHRFRRRGEIRDRRGTGAGQEELERRLVIPRPRRGEDRMPHVAGPQHVIMRRQEDRRERLGIRGAVKLRLQAGRGRKHADADRRAGRREVARGRVDEESVLAVEGQSLHGRRQRGIPRVGRQEVVPRSPQAQRLELRRARIGRDAEAVGQHVLEAHIHVDHAALRHRRRKGSEVGRPQRKRGGTEKKEDIFDHGMERKTACVGTAAGFWVRAPPCAIGRGGATARKRSASRPVFFTGRSR